MSAPTHPRRRRPGRFAGRVCLVTGSTGMGGDAAAALAAEGASVFVVSRTAAHAAALAERIRAEGVGDADHRAADLTVEAEVEATVDACLERFGRLDAVFSAAGISGRRFGDGPLHEMTLEGWQSVLSANATSQFLVCRAAVRRMLAQEPDASGGRGVLLTMSSVLASHPVPRHFSTHGYAASKGAIEGFTRGVAAFYADRGIRANAIAPSLVATPMSRRAQDDPDVRLYLERKQPLARGPLDVRDVTGLVLFLLSDDARMVTGQVVTVDGGWSVAEG